MFSCFLNCFFLPQLSDKCPICLESITFPVYIYPCGHCMDAHCLRIWMYSSNNHNCIICRQRTRFIIQENWIYTTRRFIKKFNDILFKAHVCIIMMNREKKIIHFHSPKNLSIQLWIYFLNLSINNKIHNKDWPSIHQQIIHHPVPMNTKINIQHGYYIFRKKLSP
jgi:hypothetical protein